MREPNWDAMLMHGNPYEEEPFLELMLKDIHALYDSAKTEYSEWDRIASLAVADGDTSTEGVLINRAKAEGKMIAIRRIIELFEGKDEEPDSDDGIYNGKDFDEPYGVFPYYNTPEE